MGYLSLSRGKKVTMGVCFESPDDEFVAQTASPEMQEAIIDEMQSTGATDKDFDRAAGLTTTPLANMVIVSKLPSVDDVTLFMTADELRRHVAEATAVLKTMDEAGRLVDKHMTAYRAGVRRMVRASEERDDAEL